ARRSPTPTCWPPPTSARRRWPSSARPRPVSPDAHLRTGPAPRRRCERATKPSGTERRLNTRWTGGKQGGRMHGGGRHSRDGEQVEEPEPATLRRAAAGDRAAFELLVRTYQVHVWRYLRHLLGDAQLAEDVTQETFLRVYLRLGTFKATSRFSTWVFQVAHNA